MPTHHRIQTLIKTLKSLMMPYLLLTFSMIGCITSLQTQSAPTDVTAASSEVIFTLSTPKSTYISKDAIPIELSIQNGKFDLLVPFVNVSIPGAFAQLRVMDTDSNIVVKSKRQI